MSELSEIIGALLLRNNCVVIPSLGGFVANVISAQIDVAKGIITPPKKALSFNKNLNNNDGLLISTFAQENNISFDQAAEQLSGMVKQMKSDLLNGKRIHFQNVGFLYTNKSGNIAFEQDRFFNLLLSSYGLGSVHFVAEEKEVIKEKPSKALKSAKIVSLEKTAKPNIQNPVKRAKQKVENSVDKEVDKPFSPSINPPRERSGLLKQLVKYAAVAALIPVAFYSFWIPLNTDVLQSGVIYSQDFNPFTPKSGVTYTKGSKKDDLSIDSVKTVESLEEMTSGLSSNTSIFSYPLDDDLYIPVRIDKTESVSRNTIVESDNDISGSDQSKQLGYHLIVGCFGEKQNAESLVKDLKRDGYDAFIVDYHKGLHRVSAFNSSKKTHVLKKRQSVEDLGLSSWVLKKK